jgi:hypothetical protein
MSSIILTFFQIADLFAGKIAGKIADPRRRDYLPLYSSQS